MKIAKILSCLVGLLVFFCLAGCEEAKEVKEGADSVAAQATGLNQLEKKKEMEEKLKGLSEANNKKIQDVLDQTKND